MFKIAMVEEVSDHSESDKIFQMLLNEIAITQGTIERWSSNMRFWAGSFISSLVAYATIGPERWSWIIIGIAFYSLVMIIECATRQARANNIQTALRSQIIRPIFHLNDTDPKSASSTIISLADKNRHIVSRQGYKEIFIDKNQDIADIIKYAKEEATNCLESKK
jgi:hypothetical protein